MKISRIFAHRVELPLSEGSYNGRAASPWPSSIVRSSEWERNAGLGYGELVRGPFDFRLREGVRAGLRELGPHLLGLDPRELGQLNHRMDAALEGHPYVKSGIDIACWDILGRRRDCPFAC